MNNGAVIVFARRPELGQVKTRLARFLGEDLTLALYRAFLADTLLAARESGRLVILAHTAGQHFPEQDLADICFEQRGASFGERFDSAMKNTAQWLQAKMPFVLIGADTPHLDPETFNVAFSALRESKTVVGPTINGGFYLLGFARRPVPLSRVFSGERETVDLIRLLGKADLQPRLLDLCFDVDTPDDLANLMMLMEVFEAAGACWVPKNTRRVLEEQGIVLDGTQGPGIKPTVKLVVSPSRITSRTTRRLRESSARF